MLPWITTAFTSLKNMKWIVTILGFFRKFKKEIIISLLAAVLAFAGGYWWASHNIEPQVVTKTDIVEKIVEKEVIIEKEVQKKKEDKDVKTVTTIEEKPDGSKVTKIIKEDKTETQTETKTDTDKATAVQSDKSEQNDEKLNHTPDTDKYRLGVFTSLPPAEIIDNPDNINIDYGVSGGVKVTGPFWIDTSYQIQSKEFTIGVSWEF